MFLPSHQMTKATVGLVKYCNYYAKAPDQYGVVGNIYPHSVRVQYFVKVRRLGTQQSYGIPLGSSH